MEGKQEDGITSQTVSFFNAFNSKSAEGNQGQMAPGPPLGMGLAEGQQTPLLAQPYHHPHPNRTGSSSSSNNNNNNINTIYQNPQGPHHVFPPHLQHHQQPSSGLGRHSNSVPSNLNNSGFNGPMYGGQQLPPHRRPPQQQYAPVSGGNSFTSPAPHPQAAQSQSSGYDFAQPHAQSQGMGLPSGMLTPQQQQQQQQQPHRQYGGHMTQQQSPVQAQAPLPQHQQHQTVHHTQSLDNQPSSSKSRFAFVEPVQPQQMVLLQHGQPLGQHRHHQTGQLQSHPSMRQESNNHANANAGFTSAMRASMGVDVMGAFAKGDSGLLPTSRADSVSGSAVGGGDVISEAATSGNISSANEGKPSESNLNAFFSSYGRAGNAGMVESLLYEQDTGSQAGMRNSGAQTLMHMQHGQAPPPPGQGPVQNQSQLGHAYVPLGLGASQAGVLYEGMVMGDTMQSQQRGLNSQGQGQLNSPVYSSGSGGALNGDQVSLSNVSGSAQHPQAHAEASMPGHGSYGNLSLAQTYSEPLFPRGSTIAKGNSSGPGNGANTVNQQYIMGYGRAPGGNRGGGNAASSTDLTGPFSNMNINYMGSRRESSSAINSGNNNSNGGVISEGLMGGQGAVYGHTPAHAQNNRDRGFSEAHDGKRELGQATPSQRDRTQNNRNSQGGRTRERVRDTRNRDRSDRDSHSNNRTTNQFDENLRPAPQFQQQPIKPVPELSTHYRQGLEQQLMAMSERLAPLPEALALRETLLQSIGALVKNEWADSYVRLYGSSGNQFGIRGADVDMCLFHRLSEEETNTDVIVRLAEMLEEQGHTEVLPLPGTRVPIVKFKERDSGMAVDICLNNFLAVNNTEFLRTYGEVDETLVVLARFVKFWAKQRNINEPYLGTLSSYAYVLLCIYYLQACSQPPILPNLQAMFWTKDAQGQAQLAQASDSESSDEEEEGDPDNLVEYANNSYHNNPNIPPNTNTATNPEMDANTNIGVSGNNPNLGAIGTRAPGGPTNGTTTNSNTSTNNTKSGHHHRHRGKERVTEGVRSSGKPLVRIDGFDCYYFKDVNAAKEYTAKVKRQVEAQTLGSTTNELIIDTIIGFFHHFAYNFNYHEHVVSVRKGTAISKEIKEWTPKNSQRNVRYWMCIEDPFETTHNLGRVADRNTLYDIRGEFMRASRVLTSGGTLDDLCAMYEDTNPKEKHSNRDRDGKLSSKRANERAGISSHSPNRNLDRGNASANQNSPQRGIRNNNSSHAHGQRSASLNSHDVQRSERGSRYNNNAQRGGDNIGEGGDRGSRDRDNRDRVGSNSNLSVRGYSTGKGSSNPNSHHNSPLMTYGSGYKGGNGGGNSYNNSSGNPNYHGNNPNSNKTSNYNPATGGPGSNSNNSNNLNNNSNVGGYNQPARGRGGGSNGPRDRDRDSGRDRDGRNNNQSSGVGVRQVNGYEQHSQLSREFRSNGRELRGSGDDEGDHDGATRERKQHTMQRPKRKPGQHSTHRQYPSESKAHQKHAEM
ncbi:hypothetical protein SARC_10426 [Sphaeroforma arctica JP610]|uniref:Uncharacterized protein n=1 Tax=Sphaeroforma arctica JP610 TaxID=667725 RepID=A0A0L0FK08_9EUKA|nr:hypothetical protein SARC_10426 [Sphaeroforma arctica JP610]KNC77102.1 hypothetical protein SARC_10426 [Sphaeroforma arctica JP610]|eukprot:XP_014151004.1 hypothetical protein SARC_10426 [Sphaeroforma arctica JP610]